MAAVVRSEGRRVQQGKRERGARGEGCGWGWGSGGVIDGSSCPAGRGQLLTCSPDTTCSSSNPGIVSGCRGHSPGRCSSQDGEGGGQRSDRLREGGGGGGCGGGALEEKQFHIAWEEERGGRGGCEEQVWGLKRRFYLDYFKAEHG